HLTPRQQFEINRLGVPGLQFEREERRVYPDGNLISHVVGYSGMDNKGLAGIERGFDDVLKERREPLQLSIDIRLQHILHEELTRAVQDFAAIGGAGIVMDVRTGEVLALLSFPEIGAPLVPSPWRDVSTMTVAFGHGISVSPLQLAIAASAVVNGGILRQATIVKPPEGYVPGGQQVMSPRTSEDMRRLMRLVVEQGTGKEAAAPGYLVGGKTGTAEKVAHHGYAHKALLSSFVGAFPINNP